MISSADISFSTRRENMFSVPLYQFKINQHEALNKIILEDVKVTLANYKEDLQEEKKAYGGQELWIKNWKYKKGFNVLSKVALEASDVIIERFVGVADASTLDIKVDGLWMNINKEHGYNLPHGHPNTHFACVYYVKVPEDSHAPIHFLNPDAGKLNWSSNMDRFENEWNKTDYFSDLRVDYSHKPEEGDLLIFPSYLLHYVEQNRCSEDRISIAFNLSLWRKTSR
jgi:uncharacterized protein (TIGR02466 family)